MGIENGIFTAGRLQSLLPNTVSVLELKKEGKTKTQQGSAQLLLIVDLRGEQR